MPEIQIVVSSFETGVTDENAADFEEARGVAIQRVQGLVERLSHRYPQFDFVQVFEDD